MIKKILVCILLLLMSTTSFTHENYRGGRGGGRGGGRPGGGRRPGPGFRGHGNGRILAPIRFYPGPMPRGGWRGRPYYYGGYTYTIWSWGPYAPFYNWNNHYGWRLGLYYYLPEGIVCYADNSVVPGGWTSQAVYYQSDDAINSVLGLCESDPAVQNANAQAQCQVINCSR